MVEVKVEGNILLLKCLVVEDSNYDIILGRDMMKCQVTGIDLMQDKIFFRKGVTVEEVENRQNTASECFSTRTTMLEPNSITQIDFVTKLDREEGEIRGNKELEKQGLVVLNSSIIDNEKYLIIYTSFPFSYLLCIVHTEAKTNKNKQ